MGYPRHYFDSVLRRTAELAQHFRGRRVFIVGHTGFYGSWMREYFERLRAEYGIDVSCSFGSLSSGLNVLDASTYPKELAQSDYVANCAGYIEGGDLSVHTVGSVNLRKVMAPEAVLLHFSSGAASNPHTAYGQAKIASEQRLAGTRTQIVRPFASVGPGMGLHKSLAISAFIKAHLAGQPLQVAARPITRSFCHVTDLLVQYLWVMVHGDSLPYEVGSDSRTTIEQAARAISSNVALTSTEFPTNAAQDVYVPDLTRVRALSPEITVDMDSISAILDTHTYYQLANGSTDRANIQSLETC